MQFLNHDLLHEIIGLITDTYNDREKQFTLRSLSLVCQGISDHTRSKLFANVRWPHIDKHDPEMGLHFFPEKLWVYFKYFHLDWPSHWPDLSPPLWGTVSQTPGVVHGLYTPQHLDKLEVALPKLSSINTFQLTCPFYPPMSLLHALARCPNIKDLRFTDTPFSQGLPSNSLPSDFNVERFTFVPVGEASRVGEGPHDRKFNDLSYYTRGYRKRYWNDTKGGFFAPSLPPWSARHLFSLTRPDSLKYLQVSGRYCSLMDLTINRWPSLETLVLTGPEPSVDLGFVFLSDVISKMPKLRDLRVLFSERSNVVTTSIGTYPLIGSGWPTKTVEWQTRTKEVWSQIVYLAVSKYCDLEGLFHFATMLERIACVAIINHPRVPVGLSMPDVYAIIDDIAAKGNGRQFKVFRIMMEDTLEFSLFERLHQVCPLLEVIEFEQCGYREGDRGFEWTDYGDAFERFKHLRKLRLGIPFEGCDEDEQDSAAFLRADRRDCGIYMASRIPTLIRIGFEYRTSTSSHHYEDRWLDFDIERHQDGILELHELDTSWYPFPEVWEPVTLQE